jgi:hypothetical protein
MKAMYDKKTNIMINAGCLENKFSIALVDMSKLDEDVKKIITENYENE